MGFDTSGSHHEWERCGPESGYWDRELWMVPGTLRSLHELGADQCEGAGATDPKPAPPHTHRRCGFPGPHLQSHSPLCHGVRKAQPGLSISCLKAWYWMDCLLPKNAKDSAKSAISIWEANSPQIMTPPWPLLLILSVPHRERGTQDIQHETSEPHRGLSVHWGSSYITLKYPLTCPVASQSASEVRNMAASGGRIPQAHSDQGGREVPAPVLNRTHGPECAAGCVTVGHGHRTPRTQWFLHKTLYTSLPIRKQTRNFFKI